MPARVQDKQKPAAQEAPQGRSRAQTTRPSGPPFHSVAPPGPSPPLGASSGLPTQPGGDRGDDLNKAFGGGRRQVANYLAQWSPGPASSSPNLQAPIQRMPADVGSGSPASSPPAGPPSTNRTGLPDNLKNGAEALSGLSLDDVRVHYDSSAPQKLNAFAYTQGANIYVGPGQERHLPHETWHVIQQKRGQVTPRFQFKNARINDDDQLEQEATEMGAKAQEYTRVFAPLAQAQPRTPLKSVIQAASAATGDQAPIQAKFKVMGKGMVNSVQRSIWVDKSDNLYVLQRKQESGPDVVLTFETVDGTSSRQFRIPKAFGKHVFRGYSDEAVFYSDGGDNGAQLRLTDLSHFTGYEAHSVNSIFPEIALNDYKPEFHGTSSLARVTLVPLKTTGDDELYKSSGLWVESVHISDDRPPTKYGKDGQRSHTVAWSLFRAAIENLGGQTLDALIRLISKMASQLQLPHAQGLLEAAEAARTQFRRLKNGFEVANGANVTGSFAEWQLAASELIGQYVHAYQLADATTYANGLAVGHGEPAHMATLREAEQTLTENGALSNLPAVKRAAVGMLDYQNFDDQMLGEVLQHWINDLCLAFPRLMEAHHNDIVGELGINSVDMQNITQAVGSNPTEPLDEAKKKPLDHQVNSLSGPKSTSLELNRSTFVANVVVAPSASALRRDFKVEYQKGNIQTDHAPRIGSYRVDALAIHRLDVADDRPNTRWGNLQRSHTVAWTLVRRHLINFQGKPASELVSFLRHELDILSNDIQSPQANRKIRFNGTEQAKSIARNLHDNLGDQDGFAVHQWQTMLSDLVESYITLYQLSMSATYSKEERPQGHGEAAAASNLNALEQGLQNHELAATNLWTNSSEQVVKWCTAFIDVSVATASLSPRSWLIAIDHWRNLLTGTYPNVARLPNFDSKLTAALVVADASKDIFAGYEKPKNDRDPMLIKLYESARQEIKDTPDALSADIIRVACRRLPALDAPNEAEWIAIVNALNFTQAYINGLKGPLGSYFKNAKRSDPPRKVPDSNAFATTVKDMSSYFQWVKDPNNGLIEYLYGRLVALAKNYSNATQTFVSRKKDMITRELDAALDEAIDLSAAGTIQNYQKWFMIINSVKDKMTYETLKDAILQ